MLATFTRLRFVVQASLIGSVVGFLVPTASHAADSVLLRYQDREQVVTIEDLEAFAETGEALSDDMQIFLDENPDVRAIATDVLTTEIFVSPTFLERFSNSSLGEFVLIQLNKVLGASAGSEDLDPLRTAIDSSFRDDNRFSVLEIAQNYPSDTIRLDFTGLQPIVNDVQTFVERVEPALQVAREFLQDIVCDCETAPANDTEVSSTGAGEDPSAEIDGATPVDAEESAPAEEEDASSIDVEDTEDTTPTDAEEPSQEGTEEAGSSQSATLSSEPCETY